MCIIILTSIYICTDNLLSRPSVEINTIWEPLNKTERWVIKYSVTRVIALIKFNQLGCWVWTIIMFDHLITNMWFKVPKWHHLIVQETQCVIDYGSGENVFVSISGCSRSEKLHSLFGTSDTQMTKTGEYYEISPEQEKRNKKDLALGSKEYNDRHGNNVDRNIVCILINGLTNKAYNICVYSCSGGTSGYNYTKGDTCDFNSKFIFMGPGC